MRGGRPASRSQVPAPAQALGWAGAIPFVAGAALVWVLPTPWGAVALDAMLFYGACILSFLGAVHWGLALAGSGAGGEPAAAMTWGRLGLSVVPALVAWSALLATPPLGLILLFLGFAGSLAVDLRAIALGQAPAWYRTLRKPLTLTVLASLAAALLRLV